MAAEPGQRRREVHRRVDTVDVHVVDAGVDVVVPGPHLVVAHGVVGALLDRASRDRGQADVRVDLAVVEPRLAAVVTDDDARREVGELCRDPALEHAGRLDEVVVGGDHGEVPSRLRGIREQRHRLRLLAHHEPLAGLHLVETDC